MKLTAEEIQQKISSLKTMDDVTEFMKGIAATAVAKVSEEQAEEPGPAIAGRRFRTAVRDASKVRRYEPAENDLEQNVIALYAKGLTTRDIATYLKEHHDVEISQRRFKKTTKPEAGRSLEPLHYRAEAEGFEPSRGLLP